MADLTLYHAAPSRSATVRWMLEEVGEPYDLHLLKLAEARVHEGQPCDLAAGRILAAHEVREAVVSKRALHETILVAADLRPAAGAGFAIGPAEEVHELAAVAVGACSPVACRLPELEDHLLGRPARELSQLAFEDGLFAPLSPIDDVRGSAVYRHAAVREIARRAVCAAGVPSPAGVFFREI